ncbi:rubrerythrin family protein [Chloroflexota bacterium]
MSKTIEDLKAAFAGESQANRKYLAFAEKAEKDGYKQVAKLFRAVAAAETVHAHSHLRILGEIKSTDENLQTAMAGENYEINTMYPEFMKDAETGEMKKAFTSFKWAWEVEKIHEQLYKKAIDNLGKESMDVDYYVCPVCGYTHEGPFEGRCPVCNAPGERFTKID